MISSLNQSLAFVYLSDWSLVDCYAILVSISEEIEFDWISRQQEVYQLDRGKDSKRERGWKEEKCERER